MLEIIDYQSLDLQNIFPIQILCRYYIMLSYLLFYSNIGGLLKRLNYSKIKLYDFRIIICFIKHVISSQECMFGDRRKFYEYGLEYNFFINM